MRRVSVVAACLVGTVAFAQETDFGKVEMKVSKVAGNVYVLEGVGGNIGALVGPDGIVMVDDEFAPLAPKISAALKVVSDKPVRFVLNTHFHFDHVGANAEFAGMGGTIIAQDNVRKRLADGTTVLGEKVPPAAAEVLPVITFGDKATVWLNGEEVRAIHVPSGHTDGDAVIWFVRSNVVHMGDDYVTYGFPFVDEANGGTVTGLIAGCEKVLATVPADARFIPGHGPIGAAADVRTFVQLLTDTRSAVEAEVKRGRSLDDIKASNVLAKWAEQYGQGFVKTEQWIETLHRDITRSSKGVGYLNHGHAGEAAGRDAH